MMIVAAMAKAHSLGVPQVVAILDESVLLKGFCRMDGAPLIRIEVAQNKAYTALLAHFPRISSIGSRTTPRCSRECRISLES